MVLREYLIIFLPFNTFFFFLFVDTTKYRKMQKTISTQDFSSKQLINNSCNAWESSIKYGINEKWNELIPLLFFV